MRSRQHLLACPRVSPEWELAALRALIKPQTKQSITHRTARQPWTRQCDSVVASACGDLAERLGVRFEPHLSPDGDYHLFLEFPGSDVEPAKALALLLSRRLPKHWLVFDRLLVHNGRFYRRRRGYMLTLRPASDVHLRRDIRAAVRDLL